VSVGVAVVLGIAVDLVTQRIANLRGTRQRAGDERA
jgi:hypothetical protein